MFDLRLLKPATRLLEGLGPTDQADVLHLLGLLAVNPYYDGRNKVPFQVPPVTLSLYDSPMFWIVYHIVNNTTIRVLNIGHRRNVPEPWGDKALSEDL